MSARTYTEAIRSHQRHAQRLISCVTRSVLGQAEVVRAQDGVARVDVGLLLNQGNPTRLSAPTPMSIEISQRLLIEQGLGVDRRLWSTAVVAYSYVLLGEQGLEICAYQWHPAGRSHVKHPHLHVGRGAMGNVTTFGPRGLHRIHFPTKHVELEDVLRLAITEFGVEPRRDDWEHVLA